MEYYRIQSIDDPRFAQMYKLMQEVFPPEEVLAFDLWKEPLLDEGIHVYVAIHDNQVVGATEYRYYSDFRVAMTDFTIVGQPGLGVGRFLLKHRERDIQALAEASDTKPIGMFAEIYDPYHTMHDFGGVTPMNPYVRREVLSHIGYRKLDFPYVHPSWDHEGQAVTGLDLCFMSAYDELGELPSTLVHDFLTRYYSALPNKPEAWNKMMQDLSQNPSVKLLPL